jgi:hypothetical protein
MTTILRKVHVAALPLVADHAHRPRQADNVVFKLTWGAMAAMARST